MERLMVYLVLVGIALCAGFFVYYSFLLKEIKKKVREGKEKEAFLMLCATRIPEGDVGKRIREGIKRRQDELLLKEDISREEKVELLEDLVLTDSVKDIDKQFIAHLVNVIHPHEAGRIARFAYLTGAQVDNYFLYSLTEKCERAGDNDAIRAVAALAKGEAVRMILKRIK